MPILDPLGPIPQQETLQDYITDCQRLTHDSTFRFWTQQELTDYANKARKFVAMMTSCTRQVISFDVIAASSLAEASYNLDSNLVTVPILRRVTDILDVILNYSANTVYQLKYLPFSTMIRTGLWQTQYAGTPSYYTLNNRILILLQWPAIAYPNSSIDCAIEPLDLVDLTDVDADIAFPYTECVGYYMAYLCKLKNQQRDEADAFMGDFRRQIIMTSGFGFTRKLVGR